jgi:HEAT repeat protein
MNALTSVAATALGLALGLAGLPAGARAMSDARATTAVAEDVGAWIAALGSPDANQRASAACALGEIGEKADAAIPALARLLGDEARVTDLRCGEHDKNDGRVGDDLTVGRVAAISLARINGPAVDVLLTGLRDVNWVVRRNSAFGLGLAGSDRAVEPLVAALGDAVWQVRAQSAWSLGLQGDGRAVEPLARALVDANDEVRGQAAWALGLKGDERAVPPLVDALEDRSPSVRSQAAWALGLQGDDRAVEPLVRRLGDEDQGVQAQAAWALGLKGDERALAPLTEALKASSAELRKNAAWALGLISVRDGKPGPRVNPDPKPNVSTRNRAEDQE